MKGQKLVRMMGRAVALALAGAALGIAVPAAAQFSDGYKFLEAIKKRDGDAVTKALSEPGTTIVNTRDISSGESALHIVVQRRDLVWVNFLLQQHANPNVRDAKGVTPLELATSLRFLEGIEALADAGANVDETSSTGETPLILATHLKDGDMAKLLMEKGADPDKSDNSGRSARDYATLDGRTSGVLSAIEARDAKAGKGGTYGPAMR
ncbi:ankyrin repeat domain-containing protein [Croceicoccus bisphenolivorans]|uniref:ankyrin repeat domain-containing protein n=1 Tax=Croceicoccus bisphenolivorans TaxID=1783232 RepID=UPI000B029EC7|nr:ankyrin repeat domain-containing protein [Croceicoccus bisphenolivorans]